jgi:hypothetical protein
MPCSGPLKMYANLLNDTKKPYEKVCPTYVLNHLEPALNFVLTFSNTKYSDKKAFNLLSAPN